MKKIYLFILMSFCFSSSFSQQWCPTGATWYYGVSYFMSSYVDYLKMDYVADTVINNISCKKLLKNMQVCDMRPTIEFTYDSAGKVFFFDDYYGMFFSFYDWNMNAGDSILFPVGFANTRDTLVSRIDSVRIDTLNGITLKHFYVSNRIRNPWVTMMQVNPTSEWIEGIGDIFQPFPAIYQGCDHRWAGNLRCYSDSNIGFLDFNSTQVCDFTSNIEVVAEELNPILFPNPSGDKFSIDMEDNYEIRYSIFSITGELIQPETDVIGKIDVSFLKEGIWLIKIISYDKRIVRKLIKI